MSELEAIKKRGPSDAIKHCFPDWQEDEEIYSDLLELSLSGKHEFYEYLMDNKGKSIKTLNITELNKKQENSTISKYEPKASRKKINKHINLMKARAEKLNNNKPNKNKNYKPPPTSPIMTRSKSKKNENKS